MIEEFFMLEECVISENSFCVECYFLGEEGIEGGGCGFLCKKSWG